jgi:hypothetical protein
MNPGHAINRIEAALAPDADEASSETAAPPSPRARHGARRPTSAVDTVLSLQRTVGNATVSAMLARLGDGSAQAAADPAPAPASAPGACAHPIEDVQLFGQIERRWPVIGESREIALWRASVDLGSLGSIEFSLTAGAGAEAALLAALGPGVVRNICLDGDPANACVTGSGELFVPAGLGPDIKLEASLRGSADYFGTVPLAALEGALTATATGDVQHDTAVAVTVSYEDGKVTLDTDVDLSGALGLTFALDASLLAALFGEEAWSENWNLAGWRWERDWEIIGKAAVGMSNGVARDPSLELVAEQISFEDILKAMFEGLIDANAIIAGLRRSTVAGDVPMLDPMTSLVARAAIEAHDYPLALEIVLRSLPIDASLCTVTFVDQTDQGEGLSETEVTGDNLPAGPTKVSIYTPAFSSVPWLVSSIMHEYQHVLQRQTQAVQPGAEGSDARETDAYLWELEHADQTGVIEQPDALRDLLNRLTEHFAALSPQRQDAYRARVEAVAGMVDAIVSVEPPALPGYDNIFHHGTDYDTAQSLGSADIGAFGGNDFGRGFYSHSRDNWRLAKEWAVRVSRGKKGWGVVTFPVTDDVWEEEIVEVMIFENPRHQPENIPINPDTGEKFADWAEFVAYNKRFRRDRLPEWPELQVIIGPLWGRYQNDPKVRQVVFTSTGCPVLNRPESKRLRIVYVRLNPSGAARGP